MKDGVGQSGDQVPATGRYTFVDVWGSERGEIDLRKGATFPVIGSEYRFFLKAKPKAKPVVLRIAA